MTIPVYTAKYTDDATGETWLGTVYWDKHSPRILRATIAKVIGPFETDRPQEITTAKHDAYGLQVCVLELKRKAQAMSLRLYESTYSQFAPK